MSRSSRLLALGSVALAGLVGAALTIVSAPAASASVTAAVAEPTLGTSTFGGLHNTYDKGVYKYFVDALESGAGMVEIDVWTALGKWTVSHSNPITSDNNCEKATTYSQLRKQNRNQDLRSCVDNIKAWHDQHPDAPPLLVKVEMKAGFQNDQGYGPDEFDNVWRGRLGNALFRPADLMAGGFATPDAAARAHAWPTMSALRGKVIVLVLKGTAESDNLPTEVEYANYLRSTPGTAIGFPMVKRESDTGDPRARYDAALRDWFVVFDGDAAGFAALTPAQRAFYSDNQYLFVGDDAHGLPPGVDRANPTQAQAQAQLRTFACAGGSVASSDWYHVVGWAAAIPRSAC